MNRQEEDEEKVTFKPVEEDKFQSGVHTEPELRFGIGRDYADYK
ncbi:MAG: hypothetical protein NTZ78_01520 [Candidatus Aureabacteria bacterium]|nr:hypothetical protein [Candidatus Auribacterota bacterium]